jgi:pilus assembly protein CpaE
MSVLLEADLWTAETLASAVPPDTVIVPDVVALRRLLADEPHHELVVIGPDVEMPAVVDFAGTERTTKPLLGVVLVRRRVDTLVLKEALRAGVREVVKIDDIVGLTRACLDSLELSRQMRADVLEPATVDSSLGRLVTVFSAKGGCGKTTVATNVAAAMARAGRRVCLVDLDLAFGDVAIVLQLFPERGMADVATMVNGVDRTAVGSITTSHSERLDTVLAPVEPGLAETVTADMVSELLQVLKHTYDVVVVDTPPAFTDHVLAAFDASDQLALVTTLDIPALKNLKLTLETLDLLGYARERWTVVLNRADSKVGLAVEDVEKTLGMSIAAQIPSSRAVPAAINRGVTIVHDAPGHPVSIALRKLAEHLMPDASSQVERATRRRALGLRRRPAEATA